jgi:hypothetical protein
MFTFGVRCGCKLRAVGLALCLVSASLTLPATAVLAASPTKTSAQGAESRGPIGSPAPTIAKTEPVVTPVLKPSPSTAVALVGSSARFTDGWAGSTVHADGTSTAYVARGAVDALAATLRIEAGTPGGRYDIVPVSRSMADLDALTMKIAGDESELSDQGILLSQWGPDAASNTVSIELADYAPAAARALADRYGADSISVSQAPATDGPYIPASRSDDASPWYGGVPLFYNGQKGSLCTLGFAFRGNNSGNVFSATAGHCGTGQFNTNYNHNYILGQTSTNYWPPLTSRDDVESIKTAGAFSPSVWYTENDAHNTIGWGSFGPGDQVTMDGYTTGQLPNWTIKATDQCVSGFNWSDGNPRCHIWEAKNSAAQACFQGDSGGPVYQRTSNNNEYAAGLIIGGSDDHHTCWYYGIGPFRSLVNGKLLTSTGSGG